MLARFVEDLEREGPGEPRPRLRDASEADHRAAVATTRRPARGRRRRPALRRADGGGLEPVEGDAPARKPGREGERAAASATMMRLRGAAHGYTVPPAAPAPAPPAPAPAPALDYSRFEQLHVSDDDEADEAPVAGEVPDLTGASDETRDLWNVLLKIADGDAAEARRLMANPEEIEEHPLIRCLYATST